MLEQFCGALIRRNRASIQLSTAGAHGTRLVVWSAVVLLVLHVHSRPQYCAPGLRHVASDHDAVAGTDARLLPDVPSSRPWRPGR